MVVKAQTMPIRIGPQRTLEFVRPIHTGRRAISHGREKWRSACSGVRSSADIRPRYQTALSREEEPARLARRSQLLVHGVGTPVLIGGALSLTLVVSLRCVLPARNWRRERANGRGMS